MLRLSAGALVLLLFAGTGFAQVLPFKNYTVRNGLLSNDIESIAQDSGGYMWFGTSDGISVFDGNSVKNYTTRDGLPHNFVTQILRDEKRPGVMWVVAGARLCGFSDGIFKPVDLAQGSVASIYQDRIGRIWCATPDGPVIIDGDSLMTFDLPPLRNGYKAMLEEGGDILWFALDYSLIRYSRTDSSYRLIEIPGGAHEMFHSMALDSEGDLWVVKGRGKLLLIRDTVIIGESPGFTGKESEIYGSDFIDARGERLWFYGYNGVTSVQKSRYYTGPDINYTPANGLMENTIRSAFTDREENLWLGGRDRGVLKLSTRNLFRFPLGSVWYVHHTQFATSDSNNHLWVIAQEKLTEFWVDRNGAWHSFIHEIQRADSLIIQDYDGPRVFSSLYCDSRGKLWISSLQCPGPIECYEIIRDTSAAGDRPSVLKLVRKIWVGRELKSKSMRIFCFLVSKSDELWVFISGAGLARYRVRLEDPFVDIYGTAYGVPLNYVRSLYEGRSGDIWAGSYSGGLLRISPGMKFLTYTTSDGLPDNAIWGVTGDHSGRLLIGTSNAGLAVMESDSGGTVTTLSGLPSNKVFSATEDSLHRLWLATSQGMIQEEREGSRTFLAKQEFLGAAALSCGTTRSGLVWFVTPRELIVYDYARDLPGTSAPLVHLSALKVNGNPVPVTAEVRSSSNQNSFEIGYVGVSFRDETAIRYFYRLVGAETRWNGPTPNRSVIYGHLEPGNYRFEVTAVSVSGVESAAPATISLMIARPFWLSGWFISGLASIVASVVWFAFRIRTGRLLREQKASDEFSRLLINSQESERNRVAGELHDGVGQYFLVILSRAKMALREAGRAAVTSDLEEIVSTAGQGIEDVRKVAFGLSPYDIGQFGLASSIETMLKRLTIASGIRYTTDLSGLGLNIAQSARIHIYRIIQECVTNVVKHSGATVLSVEALEGGGHLSIIIRDDGRGFRQASGTAEDPSPRGFGLAGLKERVKLLNGSLRIDSEAGRGTIVSVTIPSDDVYAGATQDGKGV
jgi:signal transduction histidine kinase/ligand-binding sensor domain-containing protein